MSVPDSGLNVGGRGSPVAAGASDWCLQKLTADLCLLCRRLSLSASPPLETEANR